MTWCVKLVSITLDLVLNALSRQLLLILFCALFQVKNDSQLLFWDISRYDSFLLNHRLVNMLLPDLFIFDFFSSDVVFVLNVKDDLAISFYAQCLAPDPVQSCLHKVISLHLGTLFKQLINLVLVDSRQWLMLFIQVLNAIR